MKTNTSVILIAVAMSNSIHTVADALSAAAPKQQQQYNNWLVVDFDGTCTVRDTITMLPRLAALAQSTTSDGALSPDASIDFQSRLSIFNTLEEEYFRRYNEVLRLDSEAAATTTTDSFSKESDDENSDDDNLAQLAASIDKLDNVSTEITHEVSKWRVLGGIGGCTHTEISKLIDLYKEKQTELEPSKAGDGKETNYNELLESLALQPNCLSVLQNCATTQNYGIGVLSINWCPGLIESILVDPLCHAGSNDNGNESLSFPRFEDVPIWSNSLDEEGVIALPFPGAISKKEQILKLQQQQQHQQQQQENDDTTRNRVVYVGDSSTDLLAIIQADVGILLGGSKSAIGLASKYGVSVKPLRDYDYSDEDGASVVWTADDWDEIGTFFDKTQLSSTTR